MPNLTSVGLTAGAPTSGTGTVSTIDNLIGTAGTASAQVVSVQGIASGTAQAVSLAAETTKVIGVVRTADGSGNLLTSTGNALDINVKSGGNANGQTTMSASAPVTIASDQSAVSVNVAKVNGATVAVGSGVQATAERVTLATDSPGIVTLGQTTKSASVPVTLASDQGSIGALSSQYPSGATAITASATGTTAATVATLAGTSGKTTYISGFCITADATALTTGTATITGTITGTLNFIQTALAVASGASILNITFNPAIPASATNTGIAINSIAAGTGGNTAVSAWGYQL